MARGDHIRVDRGGYSHHGIDVGDGTVIHYTGEVGQKTNAAVQQTSLVTFAAGGVVEIVEYADPPSDSVLDRARSRLGEDRYHLVLNNCEHFARWCRTGSHQSDQVAGAAAAAAATAGNAAMVGGSVLAISTVGAVAGLSGAGVMSGLASIGAIVGGGAVAGVGVLASAPAAVTTIAVCRSLKDEECLPEEERAARATGRTAAITGSLAGTAGSVGAIYATGTIGLSAAGITSGLAAIGSVVGGGMVAGTALAIAAPAVVAFAAGFGVYRLVRSRSDAGAPDRKRDGEEGPTPT